MFKTSKVFLKQISVWLVPLTAKCPEHEAGYEICAGSGEQGADFYVPSPESDSGPRHPMVSGGGHPPGQPGHMSRLPTDAAPVNNLTQNSSHSCQDTSL